MQVVPLKIDQKQLSKFFRKQARPNHNTAIDNLKLTAIFVVSERHTLPSGLGNV